MNPADYRPYSFFSVLRYIDLEGETKFDTKGYQLVKVNAPEELHPLIQHPITYDALGNIQFASLVKNPISYISLDSHQGLNKFELLNRIHGFISIKALYLWFVKDCSCDIEFTLNVDLEDNKCRIHRSFQRFTKANGLSENVFFNESEWLMAEEYEKKYEAINVELPFDKEAHAKSFSRLYSPSPSNYINYSKSNRIQRAMEFLGNARVSPLIVTKITTHVQILETLFAAGENGELTYKLSQRVAAYLERDITKRKAIFIEIRDYYNFRSRFLHGQAIDNKYSDRDILVKYSERIDEIMRIILSKVLDDPTPFLVEDSKVLRAYFDDLMYS